MRTRRATTFLATLATAALLAGCGGGGDDDAGDDGIASLGTSPTAEQETQTTTAPAAVGEAATATGATSDSTAIDSGVTNSTGSADDTPSTDPEQAMLDFAQCMRDNGIDMADPEFSGDGSGGGMFMAGGPEEDDGNQPSREENEAALEICEPLMAAAASQIERDPEQEAEMRKQMLAYAECMREHGIDFPDPEFGDNGEMSVQMNGPEGDNDGEGFDDEYQAADEACAEDGGIGIGPGGTLPDGDD